MFKRFICGNFCLGNERFGFFCCFIWDYSICFCSDGYSLREFGDNLGFFFKRLEFGCRWFYRREEF